VYNEWKRQWIVSPAGMVMIRTGLDYTTIFEIARVNYIHITPAIFAKLKALERYELKRDQRQREGNSSE